jgi:hypothetical protein
MFRFTIRDVLWLTVIVALGCAWAMDHRQMSWQTEVMRNQQSALTSAILGKGFFPRLNDEGPFTLTSADELKQRIIENAPPDKN